MATRIDVVRRALQHIGRLDLINAPQAEHQEYAITTFNSLVAELRARLHVWWPASSDVSGVPDMALVALSEALGGRLAGAFYSDRASPRVGVLQQEGERAENHILFIRPSGFVIGKVSEFKPEPATPLSYTEKVGDGLNRGFLLSHMLNISSPTIEVKRVASPFDVITAYSVELLTPNTLRVSFDVAPTSGEWSVKVS